MSAFAVVELFTSEGCSSCPPADDVLAELATRRTRGEPVITLGFHVDYWDDLGWREPFGSPDWTQRQRAYAAALRARGLYTPQAVVNGSVDVVGSHRRKINKAVDSALRTAGLDVIAEAEARPDTGAGAEAGTVEITGHVLGAADDRDTTLVAVLTQASASSEVTRGENARRTLHHVDVVRSLGTLEPHRVLALDVPAGIAPDDLTVTVLVQEFRTMRILGATQVAVRGR